MVEIILLYFGESKVTQKLLKDASSLKIKTPIEETHGFKVVKYFLQYPKGLIYLMCYWRNYFLKKMTPRYLPAFWSVLHNVSDEDMDFVKSEFVFFDDFLDNQCKIIEKDLY